jgi:tetratricopeptide (TPR) repeat protein
MFQWIILNHSSSRVESKTKIQSWLAVLLSVAATMFISESVQAYDPALRPWDGNQRPSDSGNHNSGRSAESAEDRNEDAARQTNHQGNVCFDNGDYQGALRYYREALARTNLESYAKVHRQNIALAQAAIFNQQAQEAWGRRDYRGALRSYEQQRTMFDGPNARKGIASAKAMIVWSEAKTAADYRRAIAMQPGLFNQENIRGVEKLEAWEKSQRDQRTREVREKAAAKDIHKSIQTFAQTLDAAPSSDGGRGNFGTTVAHPNDLAFGDPNAVSGTEKAGEQLRSADYHGKKAVAAHSAEGASWEARQVFESQGGNHGSLNAITKDGGNPMHDPEVPEEYKKDPAMVAATTKRDEDKKTMADAEAELNTLKQSHPEDHLKIAKAKQKSSTARSELGYDNWTIGQRITALRSGSSSATAEQK